MIQSDKLLNRVTATQLYAFESSIDAMLCKFSI